MTEGSGMEPGSRSTTPLRQPRDLTGRTLSGLLWIGGGKVVYAGLRLLVLVILARLLSPAEFGVVGAALVVVGFSAIFSQLGLAPAIVQRPVLERRHLEAAFTASVLLGLLLGVTLWVTAPLAAEFFRIPGVSCGCWRGSSHWKACPRSPSRRCSASCGSGGWPRWRCSRSG